MLRFLGIATLILMAVCLAVGASIALADTGTAPAAHRGERHFQPGHLKMTNTSIKIVRPWPAEQPRPPVTHRNDATKASSANQERPTAVKRTAA